ncbi:MAG: hypothetical protein COA32_06845 [Fluviicola sp.]|nr:MAG: hypothetical protein COA32_06845 [Fluviicola sp.]
MWEFKKNKERIVISMEEEVVYSRLQVNVQEEKEEQLFSIGTLKIFFHTKNTSSDEIGKLTKKSVESFFNYWIKKKGWKEFTSHMLDLGFSLRKINKLNQHKIKTYTSDATTGTSIFSEPLTLKYLNA